MVCAGEVSGDLYGASLVRALRARLTEAVATKDRTFGNGRFARNLFERAIERQATRLADVSDLSSEALEQIAEEDIQ